jgi:hypothetical protein
MKRAFVFVMSMSFAAWADGDPAAATELFKQARDAAGRGDWNAACPKFAESLQLDAKVGTAINLADCEETLGQLAGARGHLQRAIDLARVSNDDRITIARERFAAIDKRVPRLTIIFKDAPADAVVKRDSISLGAGALGAPLPVDPGTHLIVVHVPNHQDRSFDITVSEGETKSLELAAGEPLPTSSSSSVEPLAPVVDQPVPKKSGSPLRTVGFVVGGVGLAGLAAGVIGGLVAIEQNGESKNQCGASIGQGNNPNLCTAAGKSARDSARSAGDFATAMFVAGGLLAAGGLTLVLVAPKSTASARVDVRPALGGVSIQGRW